MTRYATYVSLCNQLGRQLDDILNENPFMDLQPCKQDELMGGLLRLVEKRQRRVADRFKLDRARGETWASFS